MSIEPMVWTYWEGPCPDHIGLCLESMRRHCNVTVLDRARFEALWTEDRDLPIDELYVAHRADFIRAYLLRHHGDMWIDADCIVLNRMGPLADLLASHDLVAYREPTGGISNSLLIARRDAPIVKTYYDSVADHIRQRRPISWLEIGSIPLTAAIGAHPGRAAVLPPDQIMPISWTESARLLEPVNGGLSWLGNVYCCMLSNQSMPTSIKSASRDALLQGGTVLSELFRAATGGEPVPPGCEYWREAGGEWATEYDRRKTRHPYYHIAEMMVLDQVLHHAPCRVLEWGCGTGRHLHHLCAVPGVEAYGFDQSASMTAGITWAPPEWRATHIAVGGPLEPLPYPDASFDIVFTVEALLHTRPSDLPGRLAELTRVCRGHILHIESSPLWRGYSPSHQGCWGHDFVAAYRELGLECELGTPGSARQAPYFVVVRPGSLRWKPAPAMLALYRRLEEQIEHGFAAAGVVACS